jgi:MFS family permease
MKNRSIFIAGIIGNILDHYDTALFIYLGSVIAPLFFKTDDSIMSLVKYYGVLALAVISRPLGSLIFGKMASKQSSSKALMISLIGTAFATFFIGFLPSYDSIGITATVLFLILRFIQTFFAAGESSIALIFLMENSREESRSKIVSFFNCSTMFGISLSSFISYLVLNSSHPEIYWRFAYFLGILTALVGIIIRFISFKHMAKPTFHHLNTSNTNIINIVRSNIKTVVIISILYIFSSLTYYISFVFINDYVSLIHQDISKSIMLRNNTFWLYYDLILLILIGILFKNINSKKVIEYSSICLLLFSVPGFYLLQVNSLLIIEFVRFVIITIGVVYVSSFQAYIYKICDQRSIYITHSAGITIGKDFIGKLTVSICLFLWYVSKSSISPSYYMVFVSIITLFAITTKITINKDQNEF